MTIDSLTAFSVDCSLVPHKVIAFDIAQVVLLNLFDPPAVSGELCLAVGRRATPQKAAATSV
tara:strand:- start:234 stop:419 length:186 start_codon:yes stop_codon:yes gene_type:complete